MGKLPSLDTRTRRRCARCTLDTQGPHHQPAAAAAPATEQVFEFEERTLASAGFDTALVPLRYRATYFSHVFADPIGYSAGYYAHVWSEVLARDTERWFDDHGGLTAGAE